MILVTHFLFFVPIGPFSYVLSHLFIICFIIYLFFIYLFSACVLDSFFFSFFSCVFLSTICGGVKPLTLFDNPWEG